MSGLRVVALLYRLSRNDMAPSNGFEPLTFRLTGGRSTGLSYDGIMQQALLE